jgi:hypothetical protein
MWLRSAYFTHDAKGRRIGWLRPRAPTLRELCEEIESILARLRIIDVEELPEAAQEAYMNLIAKEQVFTHHAEALLAPFHVPSRRLRRYLADCLELMSREISAFEEEFGVPGAEGFGGFLIRKVDGQKGRARE